MVFGKKNLGLNLVHYNIGGGGGSRALEASVAGKYTYTPGFKSSARAPYNWTQDQPQRNILFQAKKLGVKYFEAITYSPPAYMTVSKTFRGSPTYGLPNIDAKNLPRYAAYLATVVAKYAEWGITFDYLCPTNEPLEGWWSAPLNQEGCNMNVGLVSALYPLVKQQLDKRKSATLISGINSFTATNVELFTSISSNASATMSQIGIHSYRGVATQPFISDLDDRTAMATIAKRKKLPIATTEWSPLHLEGPDREKGLFMGSQVSMDINVVGVRSFSIFQAVSQNQKRPAFIYTPFLPNGRFTKFRPSILYYYMLHFTRWIRSEAQFFKVPSGCEQGLVAAYNNRNKRIVLVVTNMDVFSIPLSFSLSGFHTSNGKPATMSTFRTRAAPQEMYVKVASGEKISFPTTLNVVIEPKSLTTFIIDGVGP